MSNQTVCAAPLKETIQIRLERNREVLKEIRGVLGKVHDAIDNRNMVSCEGKQPTQPICCISDDIGEQWDIIQAIRDELYDITSTLA